MADSAVPGPFPDAEPGRQSLVAVALQHRHWRKREALSSGLDRVEAFLATHALDRAPWAVVALGSGIAAWFSLANPWQWAALIAAALAVALAASAVFRAEGRRPYLRQSVSVFAACLAMGCALVWAKSALVGTPGVAAPRMAILVGEVLQREEQPAQGRVRLVLAARDEAGMTLRVRVNLPLERDAAGLAEGAQVRLKARLMPPAPPMLPGSYDFARAAWFSGLAATGAVIGEPKVIRPPPPTGGMAGLQRRLSNHVRGELAGSPGAIAAAFASGDRGGISQADDDAMRDAGLTHLLSISGLHVSAVVAAAYFLALKLLGLWPWLALRTRLPIVAAGTGALAGVAYTLLTGAEVPTVRSCIGAVLVLLALVLGREPLSLRMVAVGAAFVLLLWPEAIVGPSFQMSFAAVIAIVALHGSAAMRLLAQRREEGWPMAFARQLASLLLTGVVIELVLMPIGLFHFHKAGVYGALANVIAIPLTTFVSMPLIALALLADSVGAGAPFWWLAGKSLDLLLWIAHLTAAQPGAVTRLPAFGGGSFALFLAGALWAALWRGRVRWLGLIPACAALLMLSTVRAPDLLVSGDGRHVGIAGEGAELIVLREGRSSFARDNLTEVAGMAGEVRPLADWSQAQCNRDFCLAELVRGGRRWQLLLSRGRDLAPERELAAVCERVDIVVSDRWLPRSCKPRWLKADRRLLERTGGLAIDLAAQKVRTVAEGQGAHGWWRGEQNDGNRNAAKQPERSHKAQASP